MFLAERAARLAERGSRIAAEEKASSATARADLAEAEASLAKSAASANEAMIIYLQLMIEKLKRELYGQSSDRGTQKLDQLQLEECEAAATEDEVAAILTSSTATPRRRPARKPFPDHLPRERAVLPAPTSCPCCGSARLSKLGEDVTKTLELVPRQWKVIQTVREKFACRACETITQEPAPFHPAPRGFVGLNLLATILFEKFGQHQPLNRQSERYAREGIDHSVSMLADQVGPATSALPPLHTLIAAQVLTAEPLHGDDTTVPVPVKDKADTSLMWIYVRGPPPIGAIV